MLPTTARVVALVAVYKTIASFGEREKEGQMALATTNVVQTSTATFISVAVTASLQAASVTLESYSGLLVKPEGRSLHGGGQPCHAHLKQLVSAS